MEGTMKISGRSLGVLAMCVTLLSPMAIRAQEEPATSEEPAVESDEPAETTETPSFEPGSPPEPEFAHRGFYVRGTLGIGYGGGGEEYAGTEVSVGGWGVILSAAVGGAVIENLILNADIVINYLFKPTVSVNGADVGSADATLNSAGLMGGVTYFFMPINMYLAASAGVGFVSVESHGVSVSTDMGWAINALVGKEWLTGERSGLGVAAQFNYISAPERNIDARFHTWFVGLVMSVSYD